MNACWCWCRVHLGPRPYTRAFTTRDGVYPIRIHAALTLGDDCVLPPRQPVGLARIAEQGRRRRRTLNASPFSRGFHATSGIDGISKQLESTLVPAKL